MFSCTKEEKLNDSDIGYRSSMVDRTSSMKGKVDVMDDISALAKALSRGLILNSDLRAFIKGSSVDEKNNGFNEILLNCIKSDDIGKGTTFEESLDSLVRFYSGGFGSNEVISDILLQFPTFSINIPDKFTEIDWDINDLGKTPAVVYYTPDTVINFNGAEKLNDIFTNERTIYYLNLKPAEGYAEVDLATGKLNNGKLNINDFIGDLSDSCKQEVYNYFNKIIDDCKNHNSKVIFEFSELYKIINGCDKIKDIDDVNDTPPPFCLTTPIRDVDDQHYTYNYWVGVEFQSVDAVAHVNNQPGGEKYFTFVYHWANAKDGAQQSHHRYYQMLASDLFTPATYVWVPDLSECDDEDILSGNTEHCGYFELDEPGSIQYHALPENAGKFFFSLSDSRWYLDDVGKFFNLDICEYDEVTTSYQRKHTETYTSSIDIKVPLFEKASIGWKFTNSVSVGSSVSITGASIVPIGQDPIDWCDQEEQYLDYAWGDIIYIRTGVDVLEY